MQQQSEKLKNKILHNNITSSEESSSDSDSSSEGSFVALRQEFRPNSTVRKSPAIQRRHAEPVIPNQNAQASQSVNSLPVQYETSIETFLCNTKDDKTENQYYKKDDEITLESTPKFVEVMNNGSKLERQCIGNKLQRNGKNSVVPCNSKTVSHSRAPKTRNYKKKANFQCITVSEHVTQTRIIEIDVAQLSTKKNTAAINKNNVQALQKKIKNPKKYLRNPNTKYEICTNYENYKTFSQNNLPNLFIKGECVKWNSSLELNLRNQTHSMVTGLGGVKFKKNSNDKSEWTMEEKGTQIAVTGSSNKYNNMTHQLTYNNKIKDINYNQKHFIGPSISKNKRRQVKVNMEIDIEKTVLKQNRGQVIWEIKRHPHQDMHKNNLEESDEGENFNKKFQWHCDYKDKKENDHYENYTTPTENRKTCCCGGINKEQTFGVNKGTEYNQFEDRPHEDLISERKILNSTQPKNLLSLGQKNPLIEYGREISDLIVGSHVAISTFYSFYVEWKQSRCELIHQFEQLDKSIVETSKQYKKYQDMFKVLNGLANAAANIPLPHISIASKIVSFFTGLATQFFSKSADGNINMDMPEILTSLFQDMDASSDLYMYGLQCNQQLEETTKLIEKFHSSAMNHEFDNECSDRDIITFMHSIMDYNPKHRTFYKKLHKSFQELLEKVSPLCRKFCEPFQFGSSNSVDVIGYLDWRFINMNNESVKNELEQIHFLIQNNSTAMTDLSVRMKNCIRMLNEELKSADRCVSTVSLFHTSFETLKLDSD